MTETVTPLEGVPVINVDPFSLEANAQPVQQWIADHCRREALHPDGFGARIEVNAGGRVQVQEVRANSSFLSASDPRAHFGLGAAERIETITIRWPSGIQDTIHNQAADQELVVEEGNGVSNRIRPVSLPKRSVSTPSSK